MPLLRQLVKRLCPSFILPSSSVHFSADKSGGKLDADGSKQEEAIIKQDNNDEEDKAIEEDDHDDAPIGPRPSFSNTRHLMLSSRSSFLHLPSITPTMKTKSKKKLSFSPSLYGARPSTAPSTPTTSHTSVNSSPRLLRSLSRFGVTPSSPSLPLPRLSFSLNNAINETCTGNGSRNINNKVSVEFVRKYNGASTDIRREENVITPSLSFCSKEVAEDPFARVCPSPEFSRPSTALRSISASASTSPTTSRPPSTRRHASSKSSMGQLSKSSIRPSTAPGLSSYSSSSSMQDPFVGSSSDLTSIKHGHKSKPSLSPLSTSITSSSFTSYSSGQSNPFNTYASSSLSSPTSPDLVSTFSSSYSSVRSAFSDDTFTTVDTVVTSNVSNEGGNGGQYQGSSNRYHGYASGVMGRMRSNANTMEMDEIKPLLENNYINTSSPILQEGFFFTTETGQALPASPPPPPRSESTSRSRSKKSNNGKTKMLLAMNLPLPSLPPPLSPSPVSTPKQEKEEDDESTMIPSEIVQRGFEAQERVLRSKASLRPAHVHSRFIEDLHGDPLISLNSGGEDASAPHVRDADAISKAGHFSAAPLGKKGASSLLPPPPACKRSFTAPAALLSRRQDPDLGPDPLSSDFIITDSDSMHLRSAFEEDDEEEESSMMNSTATATSTAIPSAATDYANSHFAFTQSSYDLVLSYGGDERTAIPLPQMSWFPEPPSTSASRTLFAGMKEPASSKGARGNLPTAPRRTTLIWKSRPRISNVSIGYPLKRD